MTSSIITMCILIFTDTHQVQEITHCAVRAVSLSLCYPVINCSPFGTCSISYSSHWNGRKCQHQLGRWLWRTGNTHRQGNYLVFFPKSKWNCPCSLGKPWIPVVPVDWPNHLHKNTGSKGNEKVFASGSPHGGQVTPNVVLLLLKPEEEAKCRGHLTKPPRAMAQLLVYCLTPVVYCFTLFSRGVEKTRKEQQNPHSHARIRW